MTPRGGGGGRGEDIPPPPEAPPGGEPFPEEPETGPAIPRFRAGIRTGGRDPDRRVLGHGSLDSWSFHRGSHPNARRHRRRASDELREHLGQRHTGHREQALGQGLGGYLQERQQAKQWQDYARAYDDYLKIMNPGGIRF